MIYLKPKTLDYPTASFPDWDKAFKYIKEFAECDAKQYGNYFEVYEAQIFDGIRKRQYNYHTLLGYSAKG